MPAEIDARGSGTRFAWLWDCRATRTAPWDVDLTPSRAFATVPSRGAIVPNWLLLVPRRPVLSIAHLTTAERHSLLRQAQETRTGRTVDGEQHYLFEHGPRASGTPHGCGVDQAHLHVVSLSRPLDLRRNGDLRFQYAGTEDPWDGLRGQDYLLMNADGRWAVARPKSPTSQFFRRAVAEAMGASEAWDHRRFHFADNVRRTIDNFRSD